MFQNLRNLIMELALQVNFGNDSKEDNKVYYCIYEKDTNIYINNQICIEPMPREKMKREIAQTIWRDLWNILTKN